MITMTNDQIFEAYCEMNEATKAQTKATIAKIRAEGDVYRNRVLTAVKKAAAEDNMKLFVCFGFALLETKAPAKEYTEQELTELSSLSGQY